MNLNASQEERAICLHERSTVVLMHEDVVAIDVAERRNRGETSVIRRRHLPLLKKGGVDAVFETVGGTSLHATFPLQKMTSSGSNPLKRTLELIEYMYDDLHECRDEVLFARTLDDVMRAMKEGRLALFFGLEGADAVEDSLGVLKALYHLGVCCVEPAWLYRGRIADGSWEIRGGGLSNFGAEAIREMNRLGMLIDVSHSTDASFWDILGTSSDPVISSHSNARAVCDHPRNLHDDQIRALATKGGVVGLSMNFTSKVVTPDHWELCGTIDDLLDHIDYISKLVGPQHIGLGLDLNEKERFPSEIYSRIWEGSIYDFEFAYPPGLESVSMLPNITRGLVSRGYADEEIAGILGDNFLRVLGQVLKDRARSQGRDLGGSP